jgi:anti-sigma B factor antagonist
VETIGGVTVASFADDEIVAEDVIHDVDEQLGELANGLASRDVLLNFREVRLMSSTMLAVLLKFSRRLAAVRGRVKLCCVDPSLREIFKITRFDRLFEIHDEEHLALDSF